MTTLTITPKAEADLEEIYTYTAEEWGVDQADKYQDELFHGFQLIAENFNIGSRYLHSERDYRYLHVNRHLIFYREMRHGPVNVRVLHEMMDLRVYL